MNKFCMALLMAIAVPSIASAGGVSTGKATFTNKATVDAYVILDQTKPPTIGDFLKKGGKVIPPGGKVTFSNLKQGNHTFGAKFSATTPTNTNPDQTGSFTTKNGKTTNVTIGQSMTSGT
jgi:hypothetical protein